LCGGFGKTRFLDQIMKLKTDGYYRPQAINLFILTCWTGLSFSEAMAVAWEDIDLVEMTLKVQRA
jgi:integrase